MKRAGVGHDDAAHLLADAPEPNEVGGELLRFIGSEGLRALEKGVRLPAIQSENLARLRVGDPARAIRLRHQRFQGPARALGGFVAQRLQQRVGQ